MLRVLNLICGVPGSGKTTLARKLPGRAVAADEFPGIYVDGVYQSHLQKESHDWCQETVRRWMLLNVPEITVHNVSAKNLYRQPYLDLAREHGYAVHLIDSKKIIFPDGIFAESTHNVPASVIKRMREGWEEFDPLPRLGIKPQDIAVQMTGLEFPDTIIFDLDRSIKRPKSGGNFPQSPEDFELVPEFKYWAENNYADNINLYVASSQRGIAKGRKTKEFLMEEIKLLDTELKYLDLNFLQMYFAPDDDTLECLVYEDGDWLEAKSETCFDKPNIGIFQAIEEQSDSFDTIFWIVGDAHTDEFSTDWQFAQNCQKAYPKLDIRYVPIEMLNIYWSLVQ